MSGMSMDDGYETSAPQWTDFSEITPNRNVEGDEYFDRIHDNLEVLSNFNPEKRRQNHLREKVNGKMAEVSSLFVDTSKNTNLEVSDIESTFVNDIDKIRITPIKVTSPRTTKKDPVVMQELSVHEVLTNAIKGLEIASSKSRKCQKLQLLNATVCPSSTNNAKVTSSQRKVRISRSTHFQSENSSNGKTPAAKAAAIPRNIAVPKIEISIDAQESQASSINMSKCDGISTEIPSKYENNHHNVSSVYENSSTKFKTPIKSSRSIHADTSTRKFNIKKGNSSTPVIKMPKLKTPIKIPITDVNETGVDTTRTDLLNIEVDMVPNAATQQNENTSSNHEVLKVSTAKSVSNESFNDVKMENICINENVDQPETDIIDFADDKDFQSHEEFAKKLHNDVFDDDFVVHKSNHVEHRHYHNGKPTLLTNPARRRSGIGNRRRRSNKYISLAEAVSSFQRSTPTRFHTVSSKPGPVQRVKLQATTKCTIPVSPALQSKTRVRQHAVLSQAEREELEIKNMRKHQVHANPIRPDILTAPEPLKPVAKKPITVPKPFKLSGKPKSTKLPPPPIASTSSATPLVLPLQPSSHPAIPRPKRVMALAPSEDSQSLENREIINFGIPVVNCNVQRHEARNKTTRLQPFSIDERQKEFLNKKEEKLKLLQSEQAKKMKFEFHARPAPSAMKKNSATDIAKDKLQKPSTMSHVHVVPFSFERRDRMVAKKKDELRKKIEEQERKARVFHANPAPAFKPVAVRSISRENLKIVMKTKSSENIRTEGKINYNFGNMTRGKSAECLKSGMRISGRDQTVVENQKMRSRAQSNDNMKNKLNDLKSRKTSFEQVNDQENITPNIPVSKAIKPLNMPTLKPKLKQLSVELHSDKRARLRREYDEKIRMKLEQDEERRRMEQEEKLAREQAEIAKIRKKAEIKARPMPVYKPLVVTKSNRPLTEAESPAWAKIKR